MPINTFDIGNGEMLSENMIPTAPKITVFLTRKASSRKEKASKSKSDM